MPRTEHEEIEIDLDLNTPLSKKQQRLVKKGKISADPAPAQPARLEYSVWVGNLSFDTTREELERFIVAKTAGLEELDADSAEPCMITAEDITRVNLPKTNGKAKGFAYVDFKRPQHMAACIGLLEQNLNGRNLLIKNAGSFEGRPAKELSKNPPLRILFIGNLPFDATSEVLESHFQHCGTITKIRMATFEDSGKCKGYAWVDFADEEGATKALQDKTCRKLLGRPLRMEFGEDRSKRVVKRKVEEGEVSRVEHEERRERAPREDHRERAPREDRRERAPREDRPPRAFPLRRAPREDANLGSNKRVKSSIALANAPRALAAIVASTGKKMKFD